MKKILLFSSLIFLMLSCKSNEEKALELIDKEMFKTLYDYSSYEPIETIIDSAYTTIYRDPLIRRYAIEAEVMKMLAYEATTKAEEASEYAEIYVNSYTSSGKRKCQEYLNECDKQLSLSYKYIDIWHGKEDTIRMHASNFTPQYIGWEIKHKFRCKNKGGNYNLEYYSYIINPDFSQIVSLIDLNDEDEAKIIKRIDIALQKEQRNTDDGE